MKQTVNPGVWRENVIGAIANIASRDFQEKVWFNKGDQVSSPEEIYSSIFNDFLFEDFLNSAEVNLTDLQKKRGQDLLSALEEYSLGDTRLPSPEQMIDDDVYNGLRVIVNPNGSVKTTFWIGK